MQELIAPKEVSFFDQQWNPLGTKAELLAELSRKTRIPETILNHTSKLSTCSVAQRFSWAATRIVSNWGYLVLGSEVYHDCAVGGGRIFLTTVSNFCVEDY